MSKLHLEDTREEKAKRWKFSKVICLVLYILLFIFVLLHFSLSPFGLAFTPLLWTHGFFFYQWSYFVTYGFSF